MKTSKKGRDFIKSHEGVEYKVYKDPVGLPTAGIGHLLTAEEKELFPVGKKVSVQQVDEWFERDLWKFEAAINKLVKVPINQNQFDALVSLSFNIGTGAFQNSSVLRRLNAKDYAGAAKNFTLWNKGTVKGRKVALPGLTRRRREESELFLTPVKFDEVVADEPTAFSDVKVIEVDTVFNQIEDVGNVPDEIEFVSPVSKSSVAVTIGLALVAAGAWFKAFVTENIVWIVAALVVVGITALYFTGAKKRSSDRTIALNNGISSPTGNTDN